MIPRPTHFPAKARSVRPVRAARPAPRRPATALLAWLFCAATLAIGHPPAFAGTVAFTAEERPPAPTEPSVPLPPGAPKPLKAAKRQLPPSRLPAAAAGAVLPAQESLAAMVGSAIVAINQANFTDDYSVLRALGTRELQNRTTPSALAKVFKQLRDQKIDLSPVLLLPVQFTEPPAVRPDGMLRLAGYYPSRPQQVNFTIVYYPVGGYWRIDALSVSTSPVGGASPGGTVPSAQIMPGLPDQEPVEREKPR
jgi:hypothetical protein